MMKANTPETSRHGTSNKVFGLMSCADLLVLAVSSSSCTRLVYVAVSAQFKNRHTHTHLVS